MLFKAHFFQARIRLSKPKWGRPHEYACTRQSGSGALGNLQRKYVETAICLKAGKALEKLCYSCI
jgi:hypothetical protein